ncbi:hypothetical protein YC2023_101940 [Brassica napus]
MAASTENTTNDRRRPRPPGLTLPGELGFRFSIATPRFSCSSVLISIWVSSYG